MLPIQHTPSEIIPVSGDYPSPSLFPVWQGAAARLWPGAQSEQQSGLGKAAAPSSWACHTSGSALPWAGRENQHLAAKSGQETAPATLRPHKVLPLMALVPETRGNLSSCWEDAQGAGVSIISINECQYLQLPTLFENVLPWESEGSGVWGEEKSLFRHRCTFR